jgi:hypothetical protein
VVWANYRELGYERLIYTNTLAPLKRPNWLRLSATIRS